MQAKHAGEGGKRGEVALFATCLVDLLRPSVGFAAAELIEQAGFRVVVPDQGCCGQVNFNSGDRKGAAKMAVRLIENFAAYDYVVVPSGSCAAMIKVHFATLFVADSVAAKSAAALAAKTWELSCFLHEVAGLDALPQRAESELSVTYHDACSGLRELGIKSQPRALISQLSNVTVNETADAESCCGFGGLFCVKYPEVSERIVEKKLAGIAASEGDCVVAGDLGCLLHIEGALQRRGSKTQAVHIAELLAGKSGKQK
ncbi:MAG: (Fe-S)-binding protein [Gammaproteobacteria bacterium]